MVVRITYFVHGTTTDNENGLATGWAPGKLSELGIKQSRELGKTIAGKNFDVVFCSDLKRATDSAEIVFGGRCRIIQDKRLRECNYGDFTREPAKEFKSNMNDYVYNPFPNGESYRDVERRIENFLKFLKENYEGKSVAIVAHQAPQLALEVLVNNRTWEQAIDGYWGKTGAWQPGWEYIVN